MSADFNRHRRPVHHFPEELLLDYATGSLPEGEAVLVATHLALCHECRAAAVDFEAIGGVLLSAIEPVDLAPDALARVLAGLDSATAAPGGRRADAPMADAPVTGAPVTAAPVAAALVTGALPRSLLAYVGGDTEEVFSKLTWLPLAAGVDQVHLRPLWNRADRDPSPGEWPPDVQVSLVRLAPGAVAPRHTHLGIEATVIVQGGFEDGFGRYERGDAWIVDGRVDHEPVALPGETCLCLVYQDAPLKLTG